MSNRIPVCPHCNYHVDTPNHEWGCTEGRRSYGHEERYPDAED